MQCIMIRKTIVEKKEERNQSKLRQSLSKTVSSLVCTTRGSNHEGETYSAPDLAGQLSISLRLKTKPKKPTPPKPKAKTKRPPVKCASGP